METLDFWDGFVLGIAFTTCLVGAIQLIDNLLKAKNTGVPKMPYNPPPPANTGNPKYTIPPPPPPRKIGYY